MRCLISKLYKQFSLQNNFKCIGSVQKLDDVKLKGAKSRSEKIITFYTELLASSHLRDQRSIDKHVKKNRKQLVHDRLNKLFDNYAEALILSPLAGMFMDYGNVPSAGLVTVIGKINGQNCLVAANDATVKGGTIFPVTIKKYLRAQTIAEKLRIPCIYLVDSGGAFLPLQSDIFPDRNHGGRWFRNQAVMSSKSIIQVSLVCGLCTAGAAYVPAMSDETIIVKDIGCIYLAGPPLVKAATGEDITDQELGGALLHCRDSGVSDYFAETEDAAIEKCRNKIHLLSMQQCKDMKTNYEQPVFPTEDLEILSGLEIITRKDAYEILARLLDGSKLDEFKEMYGNNLITGFGHILGTTVGILMNCGCLSSADALKGSHFIQICNVRKVPLIFLQNSKDEDKLDSSVIKDRSSLITAIASCKVPKITVNVGGCFGDLNYTMCGASMNPMFFFSWPGASMSEDALIRSQKTEDLHIDMKKFPPESSFYCATRVLNDGIIFPNDTRMILDKCLKLVKESIEETQ